MTLTTKNQILLLVIALTLLLAACANTAAYIDVSDEGKEKLVLVFDDGNLRCFLAVGADDNDFICQYIGDDVVVNSPEDKDTGKGIVVQNPALASLGLSSIELVRQEGSENVYVSREPLQNTLSTTPQDKR